MDETAAQKKEIWRKVYQYLATVDTDGFEMMNYGYDGGDLPPLALEDPAERTSFQLYQRVVGDAAIAGRRVLEVGCGRGGGAAFVRRQFAPAELCGLDYSERAIEVCRQRYGGVNGLRFQHGDAEQLPFADAEFDAVINVESSHCYASRERFFSEVFRVLGRAGQFLYADIFETVDECLRPLQDVGFTVQRQTDITAGVLRSLDVDHDRRARMFADVPPTRRAMLEDIAGLRGSTVFRAFERRDYVYVAYSLEKPAQS